MILRIEEAKYLGDFSLELTFNNGIVRVVDLAGELEGEIFWPLKDMEYFQKFHLNANTLEWDNQADIAPEYLFLISHPKDTNKLMSTKEKECCEYVKKLYEVAS